MRKASLNRLLTFCVVLVLIAPVAVRGDDHHRYYDRDHKDWHEWNDDERRAYNHYLDERHHEHHDWGQAKREEQRDYWKWRHDHPRNDWDRDRR